jgi:hypothetical protein
MDTDTTALGRLTEELVAIGGPLASLVSHMIDSAQASGSSPASINEVLAHLIEPTIEGLTDGWPDERIEDAADVLHAACERICADIFIAPPPNRRARRRR